MKPIKLNKNWNAQPNSPMPNVTVDGNIVRVDFTLNHYLYKQFKKDQKGQLAFNDCYMYRLGPVNDEGFSMGQFRYGSEDIKWGEFYELADSNWENIFPDDKIVINEGIKDDEQLKHYLFFFRDETFECIAKGYEFKK